MDMGVGEGESGAVDAATAKLLASVKELQKQVDDKLKVRHDKLEQTRLDEEQRIADKKAAAAE